MVHANKLKHHYLELYYFLICIKQYDYGLILFSYGLIFLKFHNIYARNIFQLNLLGSIPSEQFLTNNTLLLPTRRKVTFN